MTYPITQENYTDKVSPGQNRQESIVIHWWGDPSTNPKFDDIVNYLAYSDAPVSVHFVSEAGRVAQIAYLNQIAWHAMERNGSAIGIENNPRCSPGDVDTLVDLIVDIWNTVGQRLPLLNHSDVVATACPGVYKNLVDSGELYNRAVNRQEGGKNDMQPIDVWNVEIPNAPGNPTPARVILKSIDEYSGKQPARVWAEPIENTTGKKMAVKDIIKFIDKYTGETIETVERIEQKIDLILAKLEIEE